MLFFSFLVVVLLPSACKNIAPGTPKGFGETFGGPDLTGGDGRKLDG